MNETQGSKNVFLKISDEHVAKIGFLLGVPWCWGKKSRMAAIVFITQMYFVLHASCASERLLSRAARTRLQVESLLAHYILAFVKPFTLFVVS